MIDLGINSLERILTACDRNTLAGQRDYVILRLLMENSLKRQQVTAISICDFDFKLRSLMIQQPYKRQDQQNQPEIISLSLDTATALQDWLNLIHISDENGLEDSHSPLFISLDRANYGHRLTGTAIYGLVKRAAINAGVNSAIAPEQLRFSQEKYALSQDYETQNRTMLETCDSRLRLAGVSELECKNQNETHLEIGKSQIRVDDQLTNFSNTPYALAEFNPDILT
ncbi:MAG: tyrosine-type recombinase/integrase, partial [Pseudanabaena sp.]